MLLCTNGKRGYFNISAQQWKLLLSLSPLTWQVALGIIIKKLKLNGSKSANSSGESRQRAEVRSVTPSSSSGNSAHLAKWQRWPSCAAFASWSTPVASARHRHDSIALEWVAHAQYTTGDCSAQWQVCSSGGFLAPCTGTAFKSTACELSYCETLTVWALPLRSPL